MVKMCNLLLQHCSHLHRLLSLSSLAFFTFLVSFSFLFFPSSMHIDPCYVPAAHVLCLWRSSNSYVTHFAALATFSSDLLWFSFSLIPCRAPRGSFAVAVTCLIVALHFLVVRCHFQFLVAFIFSLVVDYSFWHCADYWLLILALCQLLGIQLPLIILLRTS